MARPLRIEYPGALYHVTSRGNRRAAVYRDDGDRRVFLLILASVARRFNWLCHAYCLMDNHYHLVVETLNANLSRGMRQLNGVYTQKYNARHQTTGHVFEGRYKAILVDKDSYYLEVCRYVVLNPVRAGIVSHPAEWQWSSFNATGSGSPPIPCLHTDTVLSHFGNDRPTAMSLYQKFVLDAPETKGNGSLWTALKGNLLLGSDAFVEKLNRHLQGVREIKEYPRLQRLADRPDLQEFFRNFSAGNIELRNKSIYMAHIKYGYSIRKIAGALGLHYSKVNRIVTKSNATNKT